MISALARAGFALSEPRFLDAAKRAAAFLLERFQKQGRLFRSYKDGQARVRAYLDDYAFLAAGLLDLYETTGAIRWLSTAIQLDQTLWEEFEDRGAGGFFMTAGDHESLLAREKPASDGAEPAGNPWPCSICSDSIR